MSNQIPAYAVDNSLPPSIFLSGTSCAGKTTTALSLSGRLKSYGVLAETLLSQDRRFSFPINRISSEAAQQWMILNIMAKHTDMALHTDVGVLIADRSPLCLLAYYRAQYPDSPSYAAFENLVMTWMKARLQDDPASRLFYLPPFEYQDDNKRPDAGFVHQVDVEVRLLFRKLVNLVPLPLQSRILVIAPNQRSSVLSHTLSALEVTKPRVKEHPTLEDLQSVSRLIDAQLAVKLPNPEAANDSFSDVDFWIVGKPGESYAQLAEKQAQAISFLTSHCGPSCRFDCNLTRYDILDQLPAVTILNPITA